MRAFEPMLRRIDEEIDHRRREIAVHQLEIARLEDSRKVIMRLGEDDQQRAEAVRHGSGHLVNGAHAKPMLIVRKTGSDDDDTRSVAAPLGLVKSGPRKGLPRLIKPRNQKADRAHDLSKASALRKRILEILEPGLPPLSPKEIANNLGLPATQERRKPMQNQLYLMRIGGLIQRDEESRYYRAGSS